MAHPIDQSSALTFSVWDFDNNKHDVTVNDSEQVSKVIELAIAAFTKPESTSAVLYFQGDPLEPGLNISSIPYLENLEALRIIFTE